MPKYSVGSGGSDRSAESCEICGDEDVDLYEREVAGSVLEVCKSCSSDKEVPQNEEDDDEETFTSPEGRDDQTGPENPGYTISRTDSEYWENKGSDYEKDPLPYLVPDYGQRVMEARQEEGMTTNELADEVDITEATLDAIEAGAANSNNVGGGDIRAIEEGLGIKISEE